MTRLAARLKDRLAILKATDTATESGGTTRSYTELRRVWGDVVDLGPREMAFLRVDSKTRPSIRITVRPDTEYSKDMFLKQIRTKFPNRILRVVSTRQVDARKMELLCTEVQEEADA